MANARYQTACPNCRTALLFIAREGATKLGTCPKCGRLITRADLPASAARLVAQVVPAGDSRSPRNLYIAAGIVGVIALCGLAVVITLRLSASDPVTIVVERDAPATVPVAPKKSVVVATPTATPTATPSATAGTDEPQPRGLSDSRPTARTTRFKTGDKFALLVGVRNYSEESGLSNLKWTESDVTGFGDALRAGGFPAENIVLLTNSRAAQNPDWSPTYENILSHFAAITAECDADDLLVVGFAGHGVQFSNEAEAYFCPVDARIDAAAAADRRLIPMTQIYRGLAECQAKMKLLLSDACRNDPDAPLRAAGRKRGIRAPNVFHNPIRDTNLATYFSCKAGEFAFEVDDLQHGAFFHFLIEGLKGHADLIPKPDGRVDIAELTTYAGAKTAEFIRNTYPGNAQTPHGIINIEGVVELAEAVIKPEPLVASPPPDPNREKKLELERQLAEVDALLEPKRSECESVAAELAPLEKDFQKLAGQVDSAATALKTRQTAADVEQRNISHFELTGGELQRNTVIGRHQTNIGLINFKLAKPPITQYNSVPEREADVKAVKDMAAEIDRMRAEMRTHERSKGTLKTLQAEIPLFQKEFDRLTAEIKPLEARLTPIRMKYETLAAEKQALDDQREQLRQALTQLGGMPPQPTNSPPLQPGSALPQPGSAPPQQPGSAPAPTVAPVAPVRSILDLK